MPESGKFGGHMHNGGPIADERLTLLREQRRSLARQIPAMYLILLINTSFMAFFSAGTVPLALSLTAPLLISAGLLLRMFIWLRRRDFSLVQVDAPTIERELRGTIVAAFVLSLALSLWSVMILQETDEHGMVLVAFYTVMCTVSCGYCLVALPRATDGVIVAGTFPVVIALVLSGDLRMQGTAVNLLLVAALIRHMAQSQFAQMRHLVSSWTSVERKQARVQELAHIDDLTGLANRRAFLTELAKASKVSDEIGVIMLDLDGFKPVNDTYGHAAGDELLVGTAARLSECLPQNCLLARLGGDEFAVLHIDSISPSETMILASLLRDEFNRPFTIGNQKFRIGSSVGVTHKMLDGQDAAGLIHQADLALYDAKRRKLTLPLLYSAEMAAAVRRRMAIEQALADPALDEQISLVFQPMIEPRSGRTIGFEALARWKHPVMGMVPPDEFIGIAEQSGSIERLTANLFRRAVLTANTWPAHVGLSFNLSAAEVGSPSLVERMGDVMLECAFDPSRLAVEITETAVLNDLDHARRTMDALRAVGARVWLDDFGAGFSSIAYLRDMAFDAIKLDGSLIRDVLSDSDKRNLLTGVIHLCQAINAPVVIEMVESRQQLDMLRALPVAAVQGHYLSPNMTAEHVQNWLAESAHQVGMKVASGDQASAGR